MVEKGRVAFPKIGYGASSVGVLGTVGKPLYHEADYPEHPRPYHWRDMQVSMVGVKAADAMEKKVYLHTRVPFFVYQKYSDVQGTASLGGRADMMTFLVTVQPCAAIMAQDAQVSPRDAPLAPMPWSSYCNA
ncbi:hypothetical protein COCMIDRAFT_23053 [Bipolaris oryzae ATCC 44560]|uniref:Uncharacterized protein n=1 Tax=Bipolaris oryzae ATCC 44560 TaxID=930090 RepID=W6ZH89_COCMI|nr:uncharacterized protein COCMIDRAFT_23053 [Bipolaris oryzae ATCC 44560]EUC49268.1 hypothetical protein COCMIDRAFT_23053 [Bipolaris oryzae ATCC 44560]